MNKGDNSAKLSAKQIGGAPQSRKGNKAMTVIMIISYALLFLAGVLFAVVPAMGDVVSGIGIAQKETSRAYAITLGAMWLALTPSIGYYFAFNSTNGASKKKRTTIAVITTVLLVMTTAAFFAVINLVDVGDDLFALKIKDYYELEVDEKGSADDTWFIPLTMVFGVAGIMICYLLTLFRIDYEKIKAKKSEQKSDGFFHLVLRVLTSIICFIVVFAKLVLKFKEKHVNAFIVVVTVLLTWLVFFTAFIFAIICIALFIGAIVLLLSGACSLMYTSPVRRKQIEVYDGGVKLTLTHNPYSTGDNCMQEVYEDAYGGVWYSDDGGNNVYKKQ